MRSLELKRCGAILFCRWLVLVAALSGGVIAGCGDGAQLGAGRAARDDRPNIILISVESLRADHVGCYGYQRDTTPAIDALSKEAVVFEQAYSVTSWTLTSHASMFTGLCPTAHQVIGPKDRLGASYTTMAELLRRAGYQTAGVIGGPFLRTKHNLHQGFEAYDESAANPRGNKAAWTDVTNPQVEASLTAFIKHARSRTRPFFLFAYLWDPHYDYIPPGPYNKRFVPPDAVPVDMHQYEIAGIVTKETSPNKLAYVISQYDGEILWTDAVLGRLWELLREQGIWENTAIIVTADHGEEFFEHGTKGHKNNLYVESVHVPLVIKPPGQTTPSRDNRIVSLIDLPPTVFEFARVTTDQPIHGRSLLRAAPADPGPTFFELVTSNYFTRRTTGEKYKVSNQWHAVREGDFKLVAVEKKNDEIRELYNVADDPGEQHPLGVEHQSALDSLCAALAAYRTEMERTAAGWGKPRPAELSPEDIERLRSLGYVE